MASDFKSGCDERLPEGESDNLEASNEVSHRSLALNCIDPLFIVIFEVLEVSDPSGPVHAHAIIRVIDTRRFKPEQWSTVDIISKGSPENLSSHRIHLLDEMCDFFIDHSISHPIHVIQERSDGDGNCGVVDCGKHGSMKKF